ncbi:MAG: hypothetical protein K6L75_07990 [Cellvibrionaceae bacterium]
MVTFNLKTNPTSIMDIQSTVWRPISLLCLFLSTVLISACGGGGGGGGPTANRDTIAPDNYSITTTITEINNTNEDNFSFTITTTAENINTTVNYSISDTSGNSITGISSVSSSTELYSNIDISALSAGMITLTLTLTDDASNTGNEVTITVNKVSQGTNVILSGTITFDFVPHNTVTNGLDYFSTISKEARNVEVQLLDSSDATLATTLTDSSGDYQFSVAANTAVRVRVISTIKSSNLPITPSWDFSVTDNTNGNSLYAMQGSLTNTGFTNSIRDLHAPSGWGGVNYSQPRTAAPFAILDTVYTSVQLILSADPNVNFPPAEIRWSENNKPADGNKEDGDIGTSYYDTGEGNMYILGAADTDTDEYDQHVIAHEWCHYLTDNLSRDESIGGPHSTQDQLDPRVAMSEGLCNAVSGIALNDSTYRDSGGNNQQSGFSLNLENNNLSGKGWYSEATATSILYDVSDSSDDGADNISLGFKPIYDVMTSNNYLTADAFSTLHLFFSELKTQLSVSSPSTISEINNLISFHEFTVNDELATGETNDGGDTRTLPVYQNITVDGASETFCSFDTFGTSNKLGNIKFATFSTSSLTNYSISISRTSGDNSSDPDFLLWRNSTPIAIADSDVIDNEIWSGALPADTYLLEIYDANNVFTDTGKDVCFGVNVQID